MITAPVAENQASRPARGVQICLDISGSMEGAPLTAAKESILKLIDRLDKKDSFGLVIFDDTAKVAVPTKPLIDHLKLYYFSWSSLLSSQNCILFNH